MVHVVSVSVVSVGLLTPTTGCFRRGEGCVWTAGGQVVVYRRGSEATVQFTYHRPNPSLLQRL